MEITKTLAEYPQITHDDPKLWVCVLTITDLTCSQVRHFLIKNKLDEHCYKT